MADREPDQQKWNIHQHEEVAKLIVPPSTPIEVSHQALLVDFLRDAGVVTVDNEGNEQFLTGREYFAQQEGRAFRNDDDSDDVSVLSKHLYQYFGSAGITEEGGMPPSAEQIEARGKLEFEKISAYYTQGSGRIFEHVLASLSLDMNLDLLYSGTSRAFFKKTEQGTEIVVLIASCGLGDATGLKKRFEFSGCLRYKVGVDGKRETYPYKVDLKGPDKEYAHALLDKSIAIDTTKYILSRAISPSYALPEEGAFPEGMHQVMTERVFYQKAQDIRRYEQEGILPVRLHSALALLEQSLDVQETENDYGDNVSAEYITEQLKNIGRLIGHAGPLFTAKPFYKVFGRVKHLYPDLKVDRLLQRLKFRLSIKSASYVFDSVLKRLSRMFKKPVKRWSILSEKKKTDVSVKEVMEDLSQLYVSSLGALQEGNEKEARSLEHDMGNMIRMYATELAPLFSGTTINQCVPSALARLFISIDAENSSPLGQAQILIKRAPHSATPLIGAFAYMVQKDMRENEKEEFVNDTFREKNLSRLSSSERLRLGVSVYKMLVSANEPDPVRVMHNTMPELFSLYHRVDLDRAASKAEKDIIRIFADVLKSEGVADRSRALLDGGKLNTLSNHISGYGSRLEGFDHSVHVMLKNSVPVKDEGDSDTDSLRRGV